MRQMLVIIAFASALSVGLGIWYALRPPMTVLVAPDATQLEVIDIGFGERLISYRAPGTPYAWREILHRNLATRGWMRPLVWQAGIDFPLSYTYMSSGWFGAILDRADLEGEPNRARIRVRRWVKLPCMLVGPSSGHAVSWLQSCSSAWAPLN